MAFCSEEILGTRKFIEEIWEDNGYGRELVGLGITVDGEWHETRGGVVIQQMFGLKIDSCGGGCYACVSNNGPAAEDYWANQRQAWKNAMIWAGVEWDPTITL